MQNSRNAHVRADDRISVQIGYPFWFNFQEVWQFNREYVLFVIAYSGMMAEGKYPPQHHETLYTVKGVSTYNRSCPFVNSIDLLTEICRRLDRCGVKEGSAGDLLWSDVIEQFESGYLHVETDNENIFGSFRLRPSAVLALDYCCGRDARKESFSQWKYDNKH